MTSNTELCHIIMKWNVSISLGTYQQYSSQIVNQRGKHYGHSLSEHLLLQRRQCRQNCSNAIGKINYAQEQHSQNAFYFGPNYRTSNILNKNHPPPPPHPPKKYFNSFGQSELRLDFNQGSETSDLWRIII